MMSSRNTVRIAVAMFAMSFLASCGLTGELARPDPIFGDGTRRGDAAKLPESTVDNLPQLPGESPEEVEDPLTPPDSDEELLGAVNGGAS